MQHLRYTSKILIHCIAGEDTLVLVHAHRTWRQGSLADLARTDHGPIGLVAGAETRSAALRQMRTGRSGHWDLKAGAGYFALSDEQIVQTISCDRRLEE